MLRAADHREVWTRPGGGDELANRAPAALSRGHVEYSALDVALDRGDRRVAGFRVPADQREISSRPEEPPRRVGHAPGSGDRRHLEVVAQHEAVEAETSTQQARDDRV